MAWQLLQTTLLATATQLAAPSSPTAQIQCRQVIIQNNAAGTMRVGDSTVSSTKGILLAAGPGGGSFNSGPVDCYNSYLSDFYVFGTVSQIVDVFFNT
jgi:hypothetical protein